MTPNEIKAKFLENDFERYITVFEENHLMDEKVLSTMTDEDYKSIGIEILGDRKKLQLLFNNLETEPLPLKGKQEEKSSEEKLDEKEEYINTFVDGKEFCYKSTEPNKLLCRKCHAEVSKEATLCWNCNSKLIEQRTTAGYSNQEELRPLYVHSDTYHPNSAYRPVISSKSRLAALLFSIFLGGIGVHNFYLGQIGKGIAKLLISIIAVLIYGQGISELLLFKFSSSFSGRMIFGLLLIVIVRIWSLIEIIFIASGKEIDSEGLLVSKW